MERENGRMCLKNHYKAIAKNVDEDVEVWAVQMYVNILNLVKSFRTNIYLQKIGVDTAEIEPRKVHLIFKLWDLIFTEPPRPGNILR